MITAYANGGPRNGVKLTANREWDGLVGIPYRNASEVTSSGKYYHSYHPGRYVFKRVFDQTKGTSYQVWQWKEDPSLAHKKTP